MEETNCCCSGKTKERTEEEYRSLIHRLSRIEGQVRGVRGMIENDAYCDDVLVQSAAIAAAVDAFNRELLRSHIHGCVVRDIREGREGAADELIATVERLMR